LPGYSNFSKSNNAVEAENAGLFSASKIAKIIGGGATAAGVRAVLQPVEWHHTGCWYNSTDYYRLSDAEDRRDSIIKKSKNETVIKHGYYYVEWIEWGGTRRHPRGVKHSGTYQCTIKGRFITIHTPEGDVKKRIDSRGTYFVEQEEGEHERG